MPRKPRIITVTEERLLEHALWLTAQGFPERAIVVEAWAAELDQFDAREDKVKKSAKAKAARKTKKAAKAKKSAKAK